LWPAWFKLISECKPPVVLGEQVAAAIRLGWLDLVQADLEGKDYTLGKSVLGAHGVGAPHIRQRLWFVADARSKGRWEDTGGPSPHEVENGGARRNQLQPDGDNKFVRYGSNGMAHASCEQFNGGRNAGAYGRDESPDSGGACTVEHAERAAESRLGCISVPLESKQETGLPGYANPWQDCELIQCSDGKARPTQPGLQPLAYGVSGRLGRLRAYGNAIVPQVAAEFIASYMEIGGTP
jgi:DNA (cytosine-5)-methyltransferase 1